MLCAVFTETVVDPRNDLGQRGTFESALAGTTPRQAVDALDVFGAAEQRAADDGLPTPLTALAYFSNGTSSSASAPSPRHRPAARW